MSKTSEEKLQYVTTTCPYCGVGCGLNLVVKNDKARRCGTVPAESHQRGKTLPEGHDLLGIRPQPGPAHETVDQEER